MMIMSHPHRLALASAPPLASACLRGAGQCFTDELPRPKSDEFSDGMRADGLINDDAERHDGDASTTDACIFVASTQPLGYQRLESADASEPYIVVSDHVLGSWLATMGPDWRPR